MHYLDILDVIYIHDIIVHKKYVYDESVKPASKYNDTQLEDCVKKIDACVNNPQRVFLNNELYPTIEEKAGILFLSIIKNHPFENGNKRTAVFSLFLFMALNNCWLKFKHLTLYKLAESISSKSTTEVGFDKEKEIVFNFIKKGRLNFIKTRSPGFMRRIFNKLIDHNK